LLLPHKLPLLPQFFFEDSDPLPGLKFLVRKLPLARRQEFIVIFDCLRALLQAVVRERPKEQIPGAVSI
jgi:hypothetical protein